MREKVESYLKVNGFNLLSSDSKYFKVLSKLSVSSVFISSEENEMFLLEETSSIFTETEINKIVGEIAGLAIYYPNEALTYNINLILICPIKVTSIDQEIYNKIMSFERDKYYCKKFIINSLNKSFQEELDILPITPINLQYKDGFKGYQGLNDQLIDILNDDLYQELISENPPKLRKVMSLLS